MKRWLARLLPGADPAQAIRFLLVGVWNTLFGYATYAAFTYLFTGHIPYPYVVASVVAYFVNTSVAYLFYKFFVFKTKGNYLREYARCFTVYGVGFLIGSASLPVLVAILNPLVANRASAPYIAGLIIMGANVIYSYLGHRWFTFRRKDRAV
jgi:putative flippase GtrA